MIAEMSGMAGHSLLIAISGHTNFMHFFYIIVYTYKFQYFDNSSFCQTLLKAESILFFSSPLPLLADMTVKTAFFLTCFLSNFNNPILYKERYFCGLIRPTINISQETFFLHNSSFQGS